jgi:hypothetical protein
MSAGIHRRGRRRLVAIVCLALAMGVVAGGALATPRASQYDNPSSTEPTKVVKQDVLGAKSSVVKTQAPKATTSTATLPFTGMDLALIVGLGGALVVGGFALRAAGRKRDEPS